MKSDSIDIDPEVIDDSEVVEEEIDSEVVEEEIDSEVVEVESYIEDSNEVSEYEEDSQNENVGVVAYDYTSSLSDIQNSLSVNNAMLLGVLLFLGVAMGFRKHD